MKFLKLVFRNFIFALEGDLLFKANFFIKILSAVVGDIIAPLVALLIYTNTPGIPGWTLYEFFLLQGTLILTLGIVNVFVIGLPGRIMDLIEDGDFDNYLIKPYNTLMYSISRSFDLDAIPEILVGLTIIIYSLSNLDLNLGINLMIYLLFILSAIIVQASGLIIIAALSFFFVKSSALMELYHRLLTFARYPTSIYSFPIRFFISFIFPVALASFYPAKALISGLEPNITVIMLFSVMVLFLVSLMLWEFGMRKYRSAGG